MNVEGLGVVIFIWIGLLWPIVVSIAFIVSRGSSLTSPGKFFILSVIAGYGLTLLLGQALAALLQATGLVDYILQASEHSQDIFGLGLAVIALFIGFVPQVVLSYVLYKKHS